jgi:hypothetical protein
MQPSHMYKKFQYLLIKNVKVRLCYCLSKKQSLPVKDTDGKEQHKKGYDGKGTDNKWERRIRSFNV